MKTKYIKKTCNILIIFTLFLFMFLSFNTIKVSADYNIESNENSKTIENIITDINYTIQTIDEPISIISDIDIIEELNDTVWVINPVNFREYPSIDNLPIDLLENGTELKRIGICQNGWTQVVLDDIIGYVHSDYISTVQLDSGEKGIYQKYAFDLFKEYNWDDYEMMALITLWNRESQWQPLVVNKESGAYGIPQSLPAEKMAEFGDDWRTNYKTQIQWGLNYISQRYGTPSKALKHSDETGWY